MSNFVLVHGGMIGGNCWKVVRKILEGKGHRVLSPTLTGLGERKHLSSLAIDLEIHIQDVLNTIAYEELDNVILVGHSYGGMVITGVADRIPNTVKKMIYVAAVFPKDGESMFDAVGPEIASFLFEAAQQGNGWEVPVGVPESYGIHDPEMIEWFLKMSTPHPLKSFQQNLYLRNRSLHNSKEVYIKCLQDLALDSMAHRAKDRKMAFYEINSGHFPMLTAPDVLADLLLKV